MQFPGTALRRWLVMFVSFRRTSTLLLTIGLVLAALGVYFRAKSNVARPRLSIPVPSKDLGSINPGDNIHIEFPLENKGSKPLKLSKISASCGCSPASFSRPILPPGATGAIYVDYRAPLAQSDVHHFISFESDDATKRHNAVSFSARVEWPVDYRPSGVRFVASRTEPVPPEQLEILSKSTDPLKIVQARTSDKWISLTRKHVTNTLAVYSVCVDISGLTTDHAEGYIEVDVDSSKRPKLFIPVTVALRSQLRLSPVIVNMGLSRPGLRRTIRFVIAKTEKGNTQNVRSVDVLGDGWSAHKWSLIDNEGSALLLVDVSTPLRLGYNRATLRVSYNDKEPPCEVPLTCLTK